MTKQNYTESDIELLTDAQHVRVRLAMYAGSTNPTTYQYPIFKSGSLVVDTLTFVPATYKALGEIIDNSVDELTQINIKNKTITIAADPTAGDFTIADNGRGVPIGMHASGKYTPEVVFASLRSGRNFSQDKQAGVIGMNGIGSSFVAMSSKLFEVDICRDGKRYVQAFKNGTDLIDPPKITKTKATTTGTSVHFKLDPTVYKDISLPYSLVRSRAQEIAFCNPGLNVEFNGEDFLYKGGFEEIIRSVSSSYVKIPGEIGDFYVCFDLHQGLDEQMFTWVNSSLLFDGGICNTQFMNAFSAKVVDHLAAAAKKQKCEVTKNDVKKDLLVFGILKVANPEYDAQSKTRLTGPNMRKPIEAMLDAAWTTFARKNKPWLELVLERAAKRYHGSKNKDAQAAHEKSLKKKVPGLMDATGRNRLRCQLLICEGLSAAAQICEVRDPETTGSFPLTGKINNVYGATIAQLLSMGKVTDLLAAIGLVPGKRAQRVNLNFGRVVVATDADVDGGNIFTQIVNILFQFWPELFDPENEPVVYRLQAPNVVASKGNKRIHYVNREEYEKKKDSLKGYTIEYMKGLGSMSKEDWIMILASPEKYQVPIIDDGGMKEALKLLFSPDSDARKEWLKEEND